MNYEKYKNTALIHRLFNFKTIEELIINGNYGKWEHLGNSFLGKPINMLTLGRGPIKIMLWSQMHGDEPTATAAIFDLINFFNANADENDNLRQNILENCTLYFIPVINPDGLESYTRRNAQNIDINRDYLAQQSPEGKILRKIRDTINPQFCFNLHDQSTLYCTSTQQQPVAIAFLAPAFDHSRTINWCREQAIKVIVCMLEELQNHIPGKIARFNDEFEPRAFGDNFQKAGSSTILLESGGYLGDDEKQTIRKYNFIALIKAFEVISQQTYQEKDVLNYLMIPENKKEIFHLLFKNVLFRDNLHNYRLDIALNYSEIFDKENRTLQKCWTIEDGGDLSTFNAYETIDGTDLVIDTTIQLNTLSNLQVYNQQHQIFYHWKDGIRIL
jgi:hypothetical protein